MGYVLGGGYSPGYKPPRPTDKFKPGYQRTGRVGRAARNPRRSGIERKRHRTRVPSSDEAVFPRGLEVVVLLGLLLAWATLGFLTVKNFLRIRKYHQYLHTRRAGAYQDQILKEANGHQ